MIQFINNFQNIKKFKTKKIKLKIFIDFNIINYFIKYLNQPIIPFLFINYRTDSSTIPKLSILIFISYRKEIFILILLCPKMSS